MEYTGWVTKRNKGYYQAVVNLGRDPETGKYKTMSKTVRGGKPQADAYLRDWLNQLEQEANAFQPTDMLLKDWLIYWVDTKVKQEKEINTYENYRWEITQHIIPMIGHAPLAEITPMDIQ